MKTLLFTSLLFATVSASANMAIKSRHWRTDRPIHIAIKGVNENQLNCITETLEDITSITPLRFVFFERSAPNRPRRIDVSLEVKSLVGSGGSSHVGNYFLFKEKMLLDLTPSGCGSSNRRYILHEFGHLLGLKHEHQHPDTPSYITEELLSSSSQVGEWQLVPFKPSKLKRLLVTYYDSQSIMHYISSIYGAGGYELSNGDKEILEKIYKNE